MLHVFRAVVKKEENAGKKPRVGRQSCRLKRLPRAEMNKLYGVFSDAPYFLLLKGRKCVIMN